MSLPTEGMSYMNGTEPKGIKRTMLYYYCTMALAVRDVEMALLLKCNVKINLITPSLCTLCPQGTV
jgi:NADH:ubiquinone oxidoreductase subunit 3 (subunit A)